MLTPDTKTRIRSLCHELVEALGFGCGTIEIHCSQGRPMRVWKCDKDPDLDFSNKGKPESDAGRR